MQGVSAARKISCRFDEDHAWDNVAMSLLSQYATHSDAQNVPHDLIDGLVCELADAARSVHKILAAAHRRGAPHA